MDTCPICKTNWLLKESAQACLIKCTEAQAKMFQAGAEVLEAMQDITQVRTIPMLDKPTEPKPGDAKRFNAGKLRWRNFPLFLFEDLIRVGEMGEKKYGTWNFLKGLPVTDYLDSAKRHLCEFENPYTSDMDAESKQPHLMHAAWNLLMAAFVMKYMPEKDDRYKVDKV